MSWSVLEEQVLVSLPVARSWAGRRRGLLGWETSDGKVLRRPARSTHSVGMRSAVAGAYLDRDLKALRTTSTAGSRVDIPVLAAGASVEAPDGSVYPRRLLEVWL